MRVEGQFREGILMLPQAVFPTAHRGFDNGGGGFGLFTPYPNVGKDPTLRQAADILDDESGQVDREGAVPEGIELLLDPLHSLR
jgi:hypothetical protein